MSHRNVGPYDQRGRDLLRDLLDRVGFLEKGGATAGQASFGPVITVGDVQVSVVDAGAGARNVVFTNLVNGATFTIPL